MLEISLRQLETFVVTAECASFTRAADKLHLTQSTVSTHIQSLEQPAYTARRAQKAGAYRNGQACICRRKGDTQPVRGA